MKKMQMVFASFLLSSTAYAEKITLISETPISKVYLDKSKLLVSPNAQSTIEYDSITISLSDHNPQFMTGYMLIAHVVDDCAANMQTISAIKIIDNNNNVVNQIAVKPSQTERIDLKSPKGKVHLVACEYGSKYPILTPRAEEIAPDNVIIPKISHVTENKDREKLLRVNGKDWLFLAKNDKAQMFVEPRTVKYNKSNGMATFFSKLESIDENNKDFPKGQYLIGQNVASCKDETVARLYLAKFTKEHKKVDESRTEAKNLSYTFADPSKLSGAIQRYVCEERASGLDK
ncbi:hypothetical protein AMD27_16300 (plasmid) [Acinetobacter sp. TGL-Y2]|uniref:hypothetical protein n=1 Tax=Acinetobacter sp. TGL-Y2 TaxID=1407071 RepID=UPI0007A64A38|nr:hypothetical protein [Acinetobacter sp. TGL-Y2]AMW80478.1 hypothetical protein AMD27_16300 [Acinetobacter sp. TGL-Y2]